MTVTLKISHLWIIALGAIIALGFAVNCIVYPFYEGCTPIDKDQLILAASILAGLGTARELLLRKYEYLKDMDKKNAEKSDNMLAENILKEKIWIPAIGWFLTFGYGINMLVIPFFSQFNLVEWSFLQTATSIFLTLSGAREYGYYSHKENHQKEASQNQPQTATDGTAKEATA